MKTDLTILITSALSALLLFFATIGVAFDWFTMESINAFGILVGALIALGSALYGIYKNTYALTRKAKNQANLLRSRGLK